MPLILQRLAPCRPQPLREFLRRSYQQPMLHTFQSASVGVALLNAARLTPRQPCLTPAFRPRFNSQIGQHGFPTRGQRENRRIAFETPGVRPHGLGRQRRSFRRLHHDAEKLLRSIDHDPCAQSPAALPRRVDDCPHVRRKMLLPLPLLRAGGRTPASSAARKLPVFGRSERIQGTLRQQKRRRLSQLGVVREPERAAAPRQVAAQGTRSRRGLSGRRETADRPPRRRANRHAPVRAAGGGSDLRIQGRAAKSWIA